MPYSSIRIARYFVEWAQPSAWDLTPKKLQRLVYFAHGWHLALTGGALIDDDVEAWLFGPVIPALQKALAGHKNTRVVGLASPAGPIGGGNKTDHAEATIGDALLEDWFTRGLLDKIWAIYGPYTPSELSRIAREKGGAWYEVKMDFPADVWNRAVIPTALIQSCFELLLPARHGLGAPVGGNRNLLAVASKARTPWTTFMGRFAAGRLLPAIGMILIGGLMFCRLWAESGIPGAIILPFIGIPIWLGTGLFVGAGLGFPFHRGGRGAAAGFFIQCLTLYVLFVRCGYF